MLGVSVVNYCRETFTTETQRTHRDTDEDLHMTTLLHSAYLNADNAGAVLFSLLESRKWRNWQTRQT